LHELIGAPGITLSHKVGNGQLCIGIHRRPRPYVPVSELALLFGGYVLLFCIAELPDFIALNPARLYTTYRAVVELNARRSQLFQESKDCVLGDIGHSASSPDGIPLNEGAYNGNLLGERESVHVFYYA
jgi:hypothetical protein